MITNSRETKRTVSKEDIAMTDDELISRYLGITKIPCKIQSPLRNDDANPSFTLFRRAEHVYWKDFGTGLHGDTISLLAALWNVSYKDAVEKLVHDQGYQVPFVRLIKKYKGKLRTISNSEIKVKTRKWKDWDKEFWESFGIPLEFASWCNVFPISHAFFTHKEDDGRELTATVPMDKYAYAYFEWKDGKPSVKIYQPYSDSMKWISKHDASVWDLWIHAFLFAEQKSKETLIITSSRKDAMCLWYNLGVPCMALQGEGYLPKPQVMQQVLDTFKNVYLWYDNDFKHEKDNPGQDNAKKIIALYPSIKNICIPTELQSKDPSDLFKNKGLKTLKKVWKEQK